MRRHKRTQHGGERHFCEHYDQDYAYNYQLQQHMERNHPHLDQTIHFDFHFRLQQLVQEQQQKDLRGNEKKWKL